MKRRLGKSIVVMALYLITCGISANCVPRPAYPAGTWKELVPSEAGLDAEKLREFSQKVGGNGCIVRHGYLVAAWGKYTTRADVASAAKPWYSHFLFKAIEQGKIADIDEPVMNVEGGLASINEKLGYKDKKITWRHLANQTACYGVSEPPGEAFVYNDWQMALFIDTLFKGVYGTDYADIDSDLLHPMLTDLIGCEDAPTFNARGSRPGRLAISPRDFARFGLLYLRRGLWDRKELISPGFARMATTDPLRNSLPRTSGIAAEMLPNQRSLGSEKIPDNQTDHDGSYSWLWWVNGVDRYGNRNWPAAPLDAYAALGHGGEDGMAVLPSLDIIVSWNSSGLPDGALCNDAITLLMDAVLDADPMSEQVMPNSNNPSWLVRRNGSPFYMCGPGDPEDFLYRGKLRADGTRDGDQLGLIKKLAIYGGNCIYMIAVRSHGGDGDPTQNPFIMNDPSKGLNEKVLDQWESWFSEMDNNRIVIYFIFYDDSAVPWDTGDSVSKYESDLFTSIVRRFKHHRNLIWCISEEYQECLSAARVKKLAALIRQNDDYLHPIAVHKLPGIDFAEFADDPNIDQFAIQYNADDARQLHEAVKSANRLAKGRFNLNMAEAADFGTGTEARRKIWACAMAGSYVMELGMDIKGTDAMDLEDCAGLIKFMEATNFDAMSSADDLSFAATDYVLASKRNSFILYSGDSRESVGLKHISCGDYELSWFDCATGKWVIQPNVPVVEKPVEWHKPSIMGDEVALYISPRDKGSSGKL